MFLLVRSLALSTLIVGTLAGCASGLTSKQEDEYAAMEHKGVLIEEKSTTAAWLGILPGGGSFYTGHIGLGVVNLLLWPISILWDPVSGHNGAQKTNYLITKETLKDQQTKALAALELEQSKGGMSDDVFAQKKAAINAEYSFN